MTSALVVAAAACGGSDSLTCELLADAANCWARTAAAMKACLPVGAAPATLAADRASCSFPDGTLVVFETPLPDDTTQLARLAFTIEREGARCARFVDTFENRLEVEAGQLAAVSELHPGGEFHLHCGGGPTYASDFPPRPTRRRSGHGERR